MSKIVVGLSGGVDSSVAAATLHNQGHEVVGLTLWLMKGKGQCCSEGMTDAAQLCEALGIDYKVVDSRAVFEKNIIDYVVAGYAQGVTPLPCSQCNSTVKFGPMLNYAIHEMGADYIATGHYARIHYNGQTGRYELRRAVDRNKDQSYFLYDLSQAHLAATQFPLGDKTKPQTRAIAAQLGLHTANKPESQDLCLVEQHGSMKTFLEKYLAPKPGEIVNTAGEVLGQHQGIQNYTIGQRKGLGIAAPNPLYVVSLDVGRNQVIVGERDSVTTTSCTAHRMNWVSMAPPVAPWQSPFKARVQIRYRSPAVGATIVAGSTSLASPMTSLPDSAVSIENDIAGDAERVKIIFDEPQFGVTPGQAAVLYDDEDRVLGGGIIEPVTHCL
ncbi:MAG: tRNA 2-thiouridine(34) synthase MnmA [Phormidesmis sp. RL_2_1]|nr:tRNA 2-thiouridine(34) synthase MnmA [Phormidesmis sp. RL_2_1]